MPEQTQDQAQGGQSQDTSSTSNSPENSSGTPTQDQTQDQGGDNQDQAQGGQDQDTSQDQDNQDQGDTTDNPDQDPDKDNQDTQDQDADAEDSQEDDTADDDLTEDELDALDSKVKRSLSKVRRENSNLRDRLKAEATRADRAEVALAAEGLPQDAIKFITGTTREEMERSAEELLVLLGYSGTVTPPGLPVERGGNTYRGNNGVPPSSSGNETDLDKIGSRIYRR